MKIAVLVPSLRRTAPIFVACDLSETFRERGHEVELFYLDDVVEVQPSCSTERWRWRNRSRLAGFDVVHSHMLRPDLFAAFTVPRHRERPVLVSTIHNYVREDVANTHGSIVAAVAAWGWTQAWGRMDACVVLSEDARSYYRRFLPKQEFVSIANGRAAHRLAARPVREHDALTALRSRYWIVGSNALVSRRKGLEQVVKALAHLPDSAFVLVGEGPDLDRLTRLARSLGVADRFVTLGFKDNARDYLDYYDVYAMPSRSEGLPLALLEAAAARRPIVCSTLPVFGEVFDGSQAAFFDLDDIAGLQQALSRAYDQRVELGAAAQRRFESAYSIEAVADAYLALFDRLVRRANPPALR